MTVRAILFDIDGTLVDSNYLHIDAWARAFDRIGHPVEAWRVHRALGMDSAALLDELLGDVPQQVKDEAKDGHAEFYRAVTDRLRPLPGARELVLDLQRRRVPVVFATSAPQGELDVLLEVLDVEPPISTNADDVDVAKPHPGIVQIALDRAGVDAEDAVFVGDAVWDMVAAGRAGVRAIGVRSGGIGADELRDAGAAEVLDDVRGLPGLL
ncbi:MAG TPA: HAD family hydrolase [Pseudolysinimonas sp.]|nr:HAD family hydrolase [Pseudolysinimonas sp.]